jgi:hypothetical protein
LLSRLNNTSICGKKMKVELQDNARRRKGGHPKETSRNETCFACGKPGHFARNCRQGKGNLYVIQIGMIVGVCLRADINIKRAKARRRSTDTQVAKVKAGTGVEYGLIRFKKVEKIEEREEAQKA